jgi:hypothetical protein
MDSTSVREIQSFCCGSSRRGPAACALVGVTRDRPAGISQAVAAQPVARSRQRRKALVGVLTPRRYRGLRITINRRTASSQTGRRWRTASAISTPPRHRDSSPSRTRSLRPRRSPPGSARQSRRRPTAPWSPKIHYSARRHRSSDHRKASTPQPAYPWCTSAGQHHPTATGKPKR